MRAVSVTMPKTRKQTKEKEKDVFKSDETIVDGQEWRGTKFDENELNVDDSDSSSTDEDTRRTDKRKAKEDTQNESIPRTNDQRKDLQDEQQKYKPKGVVSEARGKTKQTIPLKPWWGDSLRKWIGELKRTVFYHILPFVTIAFLVVLLAVFAPYLLPEEFRPDFLYSKNSDNYPKIFNNRVEELKQFFPNQTDRFWRIVKSRGLAHLRNKKTKKPLVILMGAPPSAHSVVDCLAKKIAWSLYPEVKASYFIDMIDGSAYSGGDGDETKKKLDDTLEDIFQQGVRSAVVMHLERLPHPSPLLFSKYCHNNGAPYKHAGILFTVHLPNEPNAALNPVEAEGSVEKFLSEIAWSKFPYEKESISALLSHIADTVVLVRKETEEVVKSVCN